MLQSFRVQNYKSYLDSGELKLSPGFNVIVGQNNVGKTALVDALSAYPYMPRSFVSI
jgi:AAA15 family ATPase/GTPase